MQTSFTKAIKPLFLQGSHVQFSSLSRKDLSHSRPHHERGYALPSPFGWVIPECFLYRIRKALQGPRSPAVLSCREGEAALVPLAPSRGDA